MNNRFISAVIVMISVHIFCFSNTSNVKSNFVIQSFVQEHSILEDVGHIIQSVINDIIKKELRITCATCPFFLPQKNHALVLFHLDALYEDGRKFLFSAFERMKHDKSLEISVIAHVDFYGDKGEVGLTSNDYQAMRLAQEIQELVYNAQNNYRRLHGIDLYDQQKSEQYPILYISLGCIRWSLIIKHIEDKKQTETVLQRIKKACKDKVESLIEEFVTTKNNKIMIRKPYLNKQ